MLTWAKPPFILPTNSLANSNRRSVIPELFIMPAARMNKGTASIGKELRLVTMRWISWLGGMFAIIR